MAEAFGGAIDWRWVSLCKGTDWLVIWRWLLEGGFSGGGRGKVGVCVGEGNVGRSSQLLSKQLSFAREK